LIGIAASVGMASRASSRATCQSGQRALCGDFALLRRAGRASDAPVKQRIELEGRLYRRGWVRRALTIGKWGWYFVPGAGRSCGWFMSLHDPQGFNTYTCKFNRDVDTDVLNLTTGVPGRELVTAFLPDGAHDVSLSFPGLRRRSLRPHGNAVVATYRPPPRRRGKPPVLSGRLTYKDRFGKSHAHGVVLKTRS
jgi:hypothetical protein